MALSKGKKAKIEARETEQRRSANIRAVSITKSLHNPFIESNWDAQARDYLRTGVVTPGSFLASKFTSAGIVA